MGVVVVVLVVVGAEENACEAAAQQLQQGEQVSIRWLIRKELEKYVQTVM